MRLGFLGLCGVLLLGGCGEPEATWVHDTKDSQAFMADRDRCNSRTDDSQANFNDRFAICMQSAGWRLEAH